MSLTRRLSATAVAHYRDEGYHFPVRVMSAAQATGFRERIDAFAAAWVALTDSRPDNGAMQVAPRTHRAPLLAHRDTWAEHNMLSRGQALETDIPIDQRVTLQLEAGEMSLHHVNLAHGSEPNRSDRARLGVAIRYVAPHVRQVKGGNASALLVRGTDRYGHFAPDPVPSRDYDPGAIARLRQAQDGFLSTRDG